MIDVITVDRDEAAARVAHQLSEVIAIYPITSSSPMGELPDPFRPEGSGRGVNGSGWAAALGVEE